MAHCPIEYPIIDLTRILANGVINHCPRVVVHFVRKNMNKFGHVIMYGTVDEQQSRGESYVETISLVRIVE
jgi:hypothetical protein